MFLLFVARTAVQNQHRPLVEWSQPLPQSLAFCLDILDEDIFEPHPENFTGDKAVLCGVEGDIVRIIALFKKQGVDGDVFSQ